MNACRALSTRCDAPEKASRPWDTDRDGFVMGEGAGVLVLESLEHARKRGAPILAEYLGGAFTCDAHHMTDPRPDGLGVSTCIELALKNSKVDKDRVIFLPFQFQQDTAHFKRIGQPLISSLAIIQSVLLHVL